MTSLASLPSVSAARIPPTYSAAKVAISECARIDECKDWADKSEALASYAKQAKDDELRKMADRIQARAIRRCGELLKEIEPAPGKRTDLEPRVDASPKSRKEAAADAGLSTDQAKTALRVANVPVEQFEAAVESEQPPTVTELAKAGTKPAPKPLIDHGRNPEDFKVSTRGQGALREFARAVYDIDTAVMVRGAMSGELQQIANNIRLAQDWLERLKRSIAGAVS